ncbi:MAG: hypothetical protein WC358_08600 [Ignavibacteria bacterium]|jgi:hypothetical protein
MKPDIYIPEVGKTCQGLINEDYDTRLSGDCKSYCICGVTDRACLGRHIEDSEDQSSQFFSRARCHMSKSKLDTCPLYGMPTDMFVSAIQIKARIRMEKQIELLGSKE